MLVNEFKLKGTKAQFERIDEAIRTCQFIRNKALRFWQDNKDSNPRWIELSRQCKVWAKEFEWCKKLNSMARQASAERAWLSINRFFKKLGKFPKFKNNNHSVEYKTTGWKLSKEINKITFTDGFMIGTLKLIGTRDLMHYTREQIKRVILLKRADGYYAQFVIKYERKEKQEKNGKEIGIDVGLESFLTDSNGKKAENPRYLRKTEIKLKRFQRQLSKKKKGSNNRKKAIKILGIVHLKVSRQRKDHAIQLACKLCFSNEKIYLEDLKIKNMVKNYKLSKSINDAGWRIFRNWLEYFGKVFDRKVIVVPPHYTSQKCSSRGEIVKKSLSQRTHKCPHCGFIADRDKNAALNILKIGQDMPELTLREKKSSVCLAPAKRIRHASLN